MSSHITVDCIFSFITNPLIKVLILTTYQKITMQFLYKTFNTGTFLSILTQEDDGSYPVLYAEQLPPAHGGDDEPHKAVHQVHNTHGSIEPKQRPVCSTKDGNMCNMKYM